MSKKDKKREEQHNPTVVLLIRHGENDWTQTGRLAGRTPGVYLNNYGRKQAKAIGKRLANTELKAIYTSPLERTVETANFIAKHHTLKIQKHPGLLEVDYGDWQGKSIKELSKTAQWPIIQFSPSRAAFPGGETMYNMQARFIKEIDSLVAKHSGQKIAVIAHADLIKSAVAHYLGVHFDLFQRIVISTASITTISFTTAGSTRVLTVNDTTHNPPSSKKERKENQK